MGLEDRDWYREEHKQRRRAEQAKSQPHRWTNRPPPDLSAYSKVITTDQSSPVKKPLYYIGLFLILCLAIYGAIAFIYYIQHPIKKPQQQQLQKSDTSKEKPKPAVKYL